MCMCTPVGSTAQWPPMRWASAPCCRLGRRRTPPPPLIVLEATGGYEVVVAATLGSAGLPVVVVNPRQVQDFARATGQLAKTDALDAAVIARFAAAVQPPVRPLPTAAGEALGALVARRRQLLDMLGAERNRQGQARDPPAAAPDWAACAVVGAGGDRR